MLFPDTPAEEAMLLLEEFRKKIEVSEFEYDGQKLMFTISIGVAQAGLHSKDARVLFNLADDALYECKRGGRNQIRMAKMQKEAEDAGIIPSGTKAG